MTRGRRKLSTTVYLTAEQDAALKEMNRLTKVPVAEMIRQAIDDYLALHEERGGILQRKRAALP